MRYHVFDILDKHSIPYDQVALVDADTMIRWDCPNFFELSERKFCVVRDEKRRLWVKKSIRSFQPFYPGIKLDPRDYFNAGFMIFNENHHGLFQAMVQFYHSNKTRIQEVTRTLRKGTDQSSLNFMVMKQNIGIKYLAEQYNYMHFVKFRYNNPWLIRKCNISTFVQKGFIWHFIGIDKRLNDSIMGKTWEHIRHQYV
jgi:lipopolysaccharide biosynthesis glycosyltransferase